MALLAILSSTLYMRPQMKRCVWVALSLFLLAGCAHLEVPRQEIYPFRAEFTASGKVQGEDLALRGAVLLTSPESGVIQTYGPGGVAAGTIDISDSRLLVRDMWGRPGRVVELPLRGIVGLAAGDMPRSAYLYRARTEGGTKVVYPWGLLFVDEAVLPRRLHVPGDKDLDVEFTPSGRNVTLHVQYGVDHLWISFLVSQGGRWISS